MQTFIPPTVFMCGLSTNKTNTLYEISLLRLLNKEFRNEFNFNKYNIVKSRLSIYTELFEISNKNNIDIINYLLNSDFNISEFDRLCNNMVYMNYRNYGVKYGLYFKHHLFTYKHLDNIKNNITLFRIFYDYAGELMLQQQYAPTDIQKYVYLWLSDYMLLAINKTFQTIHSIINLISADDFKLILSGCNYNFDIFQFYEILVRAFSNIKQTEFVNTLDTTTFKEYGIIIQILIRIYDNVQITNNKDILDFLFLQIMIFSRNSLLKIGKQHFPLEFLSSLFAKAQETIGIILINIQNNTANNNHHHLMTVCNEIINILI